MPNPIKYTTGSENDALKKGNLYIGTGAVGKGPSDVTGYYQGPSVPSNGYVIYMNKVGAPGSLSYHSAANDAQLISFTNNLAGQSYTTIQQCFDYYYGQTDKVLVTQDYPSTFPYIVLDGLVLYLDAGILQSYPGSGTAWSDINGLGPKNDGTLINGPTFNSDNGGSIVFDGVDDFVRVSNPQSLANQNLTVSTWVKPSTATNPITIIIDYDHCAICNWVLQSEDATTNRRYYFGYRSTSNVWEPSNGIGTGRGIQLSNSVWQNLTFTKNGTSIIGYLNGTQTYTSTAGSGDILYNTSKNLSLGAGISCSSRNFNGNIVTSQIYNRALSADEVLQNYNVMKSRFGL